MSQTNMSTASVDESGLYTSYEITSNGLHAHSPVPSQLAVPDRGMTTPSSPWNHITPPSGSSPDINSDGYQEVPLPAAAPGATVQLGAPNDAVGDLLGLKSDQPRRRPSDEPGHSKVKKCKITQRKAKIAPMPASLRQQDLIVKPTKGKRKSPLSEEGRRNAEAVRQNGGQCIRCRLYKAKVLYSLSSPLLALIWHSVTQVILVRNAIKNSIPQSCFANHAIVIT